MTDIGKDKIGSGVVKQMCQLYTKRHELAHEIAWDIDVGKDEAVSYIDAVRFFILYIKHFVQSYFSKENTTTEEILLECETYKNVNYMSRIENPDTPMTQCEMNEMSFNAFKEAEKELDRIVPLIKDNLPEESVDELNYIPLWKEYCKQKAEITTKSYEGGSMRPLLINSVMEECTQQEIKLLKEKYSTILAKF